jgi:hypothetical protein
MTGTVQLGAGVKRATLRAVVLNRDGTVKRDLGVVAFGSTESRFARIWRRAKQEIRAWLRF